MYKLYSATTLITQSAYGENMSQGTKFFGRLGIVGGISDAGASKGRSGGTADLGAALGAALEAAVEMAVGAAAPTADAVSLPVPVDDV